MSSAYNTPSTTDTPVQSLNVLLPMAPIVETVTDDDPDNWDEGRDDIPYDTEINAVDIWFPILVTSADVFSDEPAPPQLAVSNKPHMVQAQLDSGAFVSCTNPLHMLHDYTAFLAAVFAAKHAKYLQAILKELGFPQHDPTPLYKDNMSAIKMNNS